MENEFHEKNIAGLGIEPQTYKMSWFGSNQTEFAK